MIAALFLQHLLIDSEPVSLLLGAFVAPRDVSIVEGLLLLVVCVAGLLGWRNEVHKRHIAVSEERHRIDTALNAQRVERKQNEALTEEIRERKKAEVQLRYAAEHDSLTGLYNRTFLIDELNRTLKERSSRSKSMTELMYLDLDSFKMVNDTFGHRMGDLLLLEITQRLKLFLREPDLLIRFSGGDEFVVLTENHKGPEQTERMARRLLDAIEQPFSIAGMSFPVTASVGICEVNAGYAEAEDVLRDADIAMFRAKREGGGRFLRYDPAMQEDVLAAMQAKLQLKGAVEKGEFELHFQPLIDLRDRSIYGMEALIRWNHPTRGFLAPGAFIALAEETGHIVPMGTWVLHEACQALQRFQAASTRNLTMSLNVSSKQLEVPGFLSILHSALDASGVDPRYVQLEITESIFIKDAVRIGQLFKEIRSFGVQIAFDDFGTGYSSLSYLERYPIDTLKLDQSFVRNMAPNSVNAEIVPMIINMAAAIGMKVSAEGVEEEEHAATLLDFGCTLAQGYLFSKPVNFSTMLAMTVADSEGRYGKAALQKHAVLAFPMRETSLEGHALNLVRARP